METQILTQDRFPVIICRDESDRIAAAQRLNRALLQEFNPLETYVILKNAEAIIKDSLEIGKEGAIMKLEAKEENVLGVKVSQRRAVEYEYDHPRLIKIDAEMEVLKAEKKKLQTLLQSMTKPQADIDTGEIINPAKKTRDGLNIAVTLHK